MRVTDAGAALEVVRASYRRPGLASDWLQHVTEAALPLLDQGLGVIGVHFSVTETTRIRLLAEPCVAGDAPAGYEEVGREIFQALEPRDVRDTWTNELSLDSGSDAYYRRFPHGRFSDFAVFDRSRRHGVMDNAVAKMWGPDNVGVLFCAPCAGESTVDTRDRRRWDLLMAHVVAGARLLTLGVGAQEEAVLDGEGRLLHAEGVARDGEAREWLRRAAITHDRARSRKGALDPAGALEAWQALVAGRWSIVDRFDTDGRRFLVAHPNEPDVRLTSMLSERERQVAGYAALGYPNKRIAYTLGLTESTVSAHLHSGMRRLGVEQVSSLLGLLFGDGAPFQFDARSEDGDRGTDGAGRR